MKTPPTFNEYAVVVPAGQDRVVAKYEIDQFLRQYGRYYAHQVGINPRDLTFALAETTPTDLNFTMQEPNGRRSTLMVKQPLTEVKAWRYAANNLLDLNKNDDHVIAPFDYYTDETQQQVLYAQPYINPEWRVTNPARWGQGEAFDPATRAAVTTSMVAKLVNLYDFKNHEGVICCRLQAGDFILTPGWQQDQVTPTSILPHLYLTAARVKLRCSYNKYLRILEQELTTTPEQTPNTRRFMATPDWPLMTPEVVAAGIKLGRELNQARTALYRQPSADRQPE